MSVDLRVDWCSYEAAKYAVEHWHYSKCMPKSKLVKFGVWEDGGFIGAVIFGVGATPNVTSCYGLRNTQMCELVRVALKQHRSPVSRIVTIALKVLKRHCPGLRLIVSYADPAENHVGGIYQAMNWVYVGVGADDKKILANGQWKHRRTVGHGGTSSVKDRIWKAIPGKYKYLYPLDRAMRRQIAPLAKPYPKRENARPANGSTPATSQGRRFDSDQAA